MKKTGETLNIKGSKFMYAWMTLVIFGGVFSSLFLIKQGLLFESNYSLIYLGGGVVFLPIMLYLTLWILPGFMPGKVLLSIVPKENGVVKYKNKMFLIKDIRNIDLIRNPLNLINDIVIESFDGKKLKIRTYNLIDELDYEVMVDKYIYPYMTDNAKKVWDRKVNLELLHEEVKYVREDQ
ncbi:hypothetical protein A9C19_01375 [Bacillus weihaiensis]|uniref:YfjD family protein n=1 Tax=Bacillus weihaiensis TaxID=1547283 RepID=A0A1L3MX46_9BACI|nr:hypothetical protein A9C19_01375 [Bacillus weihaiensis]